MRARWFSANLLAMAMAVGLAGLGAGALAQDVGPDLSQILTMTANSGTSNQDSLQNQLNTIVLTPPGNVPGAKTPKLALKKEFSAATLQALVAEHPELEKLAVSSQACRVDFMDRCANFATAFKEKFIGAFAKAGLNMNNHEGRYSHLNIVPLAGYSMYSRSPEFNDGNIGMVASLVNEDTMEVGAFNIPIDAKKLGINAGSKNSVVQITGVDIAQGDFLISFDAGERCTEGKREFGFVIRVALGSGQPKVKWISPKNVSDASFAVRDNRIYTVNGGSCVDDYLYELDLDSGKVLARMKLPSGADFINSDGERLLLGLYGGAVTYRLP